MALTFQRMDGKMLHLNNSSQKNNGESIATTSLQPMGFTDILDTTFNLFRNSFRLFFSICTVYFFFHVAFSAFAHHEGVQIFSDVAVLVLCYWALTFASAQAVLKRHITPRIAFRQVKRRFWPLLGSSLLYWLVFVSLSVTIIGIPFAIYFFTRWSFNAQAVMIEETSATNALRRSRELVKGSWWRVFGITFAIFLLSIVIELILTTSSTFIFALSGIAGKINLLEMILHTMPNDEIEGTWHLLHAVHTAIEALIMPITAIGFTLLYFDLRIRKEGFDIEMKIAKDEVKEYLKP